MKMRWLCMTMILIGSSCAAPRTSPGAVDRDVESPPVLEGANLRRLQLSSIILSSDDDTITRQDRTAAAAELLSLELPQSRALIIESLREGRPEVVLAALTAMRDAARLDPAYRTALIALLPEVTGESQDTLAEVLARHGQQNSAMLEEIAAVAASSSADPQSRQAAVKAIGSFRHAPAVAAAHLMALVSEQKSPDDIRRAAMAQLARLTGLPTDQSAAWWMGWWSANRDRPSERWLQDTVDALTRQTAELQRQLTDAEAARTAMADRVLETYRAFWPLLSIDQQQVKLDGLLDDPLDAVRLFAIERLAVLLRDGHDATVAQTKAASLLSTGSVPVRKAVAALLPELQPELVDDTLAARFMQEEDMSVRAAMLPLVATRAPAVISPAHLRAMLADPSTRRVALDAAKTLLATNAAAPAFKDSIRPDVRSLHSESPSLRTAEVLGLVGDDADLAGLAAGLDAGDAKWKETVAEALLRRGVTEPLIDRAADAAIYPAALEAARKSSGIDTLTKVAGMTPPEQHRDRWVEGVLGEAMEIPAANRLAADSILQTLSANITAAQRASVLQDAWAAGSPEDPTARIDLARRIAEVELLAGNPQAAVAVLDQIATEALGADLRALKFDAAIRGRLYDAAAAIHQEPELWISTFESLQQSQPEVADLVRMEIVRRFQDALDSSMRERLDLAADPLMGDATPDAEES